jgi:hypothetical protein
MLSKGDRTMSNLFRGRQELKSTKADTKISGEREPSEERLNRYRSKMQQMEERRVISAATRSQTKDVPTSNQLSELQALLELMEKVQIKKREIDGNTPYNHEGKSANFNLFGSNSPSLATQMGEWWLVDTPLLAAGSFIIFAYL